MSFCSNVKCRITLDTPTNGCCMRAETYGLLLFSHMLVKKKHNYKTELHETAALMAELIAACCGVFVDVSEGLSRDKSRTVYSVAIPNPAQREQVLASFGMTEETAEHIDMGIIENDCCREAFIKGAFLACGSMSSPDKGYHVEFTAHSESLCKELSELLKDFQLNCNISARRSSYCAYIKDGASIEAMLALLGAGDAYYEMVKLRIYKEVINNVNRTLNCDNANISKTVNAAQQQIAAIKRIEKAYGLEALPEELREIALLRLEYGEETLRGLGQLLDPPLSRSGVNHRMQRLLELDPERKEGK